jgi:hypothetical protein
MRVQLKNIKYCEWNSEETDNFKADIYFDKVKIGYCENDGRGGSTSTHFYPYDMKDKFLECMTYCESLPKIKYTHSTYPSFEVNSNLENVCDKLFSDWQNAKHDKTFKKDMNKGICYGKSKYYYEIQTFLMNGKSTTIKELLATDSGVGHLKRVCARLIAEGHTILNDNLTFKI